MGLELRDLEELANTRAMQNSVLQAELDGIKRQLAESNQRLSSAEASNQTFELDIERLNDDLTNQHSVTSKLHDTLNKTNTKYEELNNDFESQFMTSSFQNLFHFLNLVKFRHVRLM